MKIGVWSWDTGTTDRSTLILHQELSICPEVRISCSAIASCFSPSLSLSLSLSLSPCLSPLSLPSLSHEHTHTHTHTLSLSHTHTHTLFTHLNRVKCPHSHLWWGSERTLGPEAHDLPKNSLPHFFCVNFLCLEFATQMIKQQKSLTNFNLYIQCLKKLSMHQHHAALG